MKHNLSDLNGYLFEQLERLNDPELDEEGFKKEVQRSNAINNIAKTVVSNANLVLQAQKFADDRMDADMELPKMLEGDV